MELRPIELVIDSTLQIYQSPECVSLIQSMKDFYSIIGFNLPWIGYFIIRNNEVVGTVGFTGQPNDGKVEIAYWTFKKHENQGIASFACKQIINIALSEDQEVKIIAKTAPEVNASTKILEKNGFVFTEIVQDHEIGDAWLWSLKV